jgi:two-component system LytT family response regulator
MTTRSPVSLRVLVVDDEAPARQRLSDLLRRDPEVSEILEASDGASAVEAVERDRPDLVFLDVQMPELDGLGVVRLVGPERMPLAVFVTAHDRHALEAFEANALDYLLKPFSDERYEATMARVKARLGERDAGQLGHRLLKLVAAAPAPTAAGPPLDRIVVKANGAALFVRAADIDWIEAAGVYVTLHVGGRGLLHRASLGDLARALDPARFVRVHRSALLNLERVVRLEPLTHGEFEAVLANGARCRVSRTYRGELERRLGQSL